mmetsp:Transcript_71482/g.113259  ORF Transcript_71482/g.113259 Transcript_71482/m.113259 type:complete len:103 (+) Transcript_71482:833-1141(+)
MLGVRAQAHKEASCLMSISILMVMIVMLVAWRCDSMQVYPAWGKRCKLVVFHKIHSIHTSANICCYCYGVINSSSSLLARAKYPRCPYSACLLSWLILCVGV